jgi:hypothetical protein
MKVSPCSHQQAPLLEQVAAPIGGLDLIADHKASASPGPTPVSILRFGAQWHHVGGCVAVRNDDRQMPRPPL